MMKKRIGFICTVFLLFLTGCIPTVDNNEEDIIIVEETDDLNEQEYVITPTIDTPENFYRTVLLDGEYQRSGARGVVADAMNNRVDIDQLEMGLMEIASATYDQSEFFFLEGEYLSGDTINRWLRRYDPSNQRYTDGLNPSLGGIEVDDDGEEIGLEVDVDSLSEPELEELMRKHPLILSNVLEHNYVYGNAEEGVNLGGIVIGLSLRSVYYYRTEVEDDDGTILFNQYEHRLELDEVEEHGKQIAQQVVNRLRDHHEDLADVPITIALYQEQPRGAIVPGSFIAMTQVQSDETQIQGWEAINEEYFFFPSGAASQAYPNHSNAFAQFKEEMENFFGRSMGIVGKGRYKNDSLDELTIEFNLQSHGKAEIISLTQYVSGQIDEIFNVSVPINVYINSINGPESLIVKYPEHEPYIHVYK